jgi:diacylglycerol kinase
MVFIKPAGSRKMALLRMIRIVLWSFFGVRRRASHEADFAQVNFSLLPVIAVVLALCIGASIFGVVMLVTHGANVPTQGF